MTTKVEARVWLIEGKVDGGWVAMAGRSFTNKRLGYRALRSIREQFSDYPPKTFRLEEYVRKYL